MSIPHNTEAGIQPAVGLKRKTVDGIEPRWAARKHRSSQACQSCRTRKVRCDITANGPMNSARCTNCRLDNTDCTVLPSRRGKNNRVRRDGLQKAASSTPPDQARAESEPNQNLATYRSCARQESAPMAFTPGAVGVPACVTFDEDSDQPPSDDQSIPLAGDALDANVTHVDTRAALYMSEDGRDSIGHQSSIDLVSLPSFIAPISPRMLGEDVDYLARKGAFVVPDAEVRLEVVRAYLFSVHPFMPILDHEKFINALTETEGAGQITMLLFQAVMFAGINSLPLETISRMGYKSTKEAREVLFTRTRLLYEFDVDSDNAEVFQALVLMSTWYSKTDARRHTWHWTGLAYDLARRMGLHREPNTQFTPEKVRRVRRRMWWSLYIRDRMIALGTRSPMRIFHDDFNVAMLTMEDLDLEYLDSIQDQRLLMTTSEDRASAGQMCIQLAALGRVIEHAVSSQYTTLSSHTNVPYTTMVVSRRDDSSMAELEKCDQELNDWFDSLNTSIQWPKSMVLDVSRSFSEIHWATLNMAYLTAINVLHRSQALHPESHNTDAETAQRSSRDKVKQAARSLTKVAQTLLKNDQVRFLSLIGVTALIAACLCHMLDVRSSDEDVRDASTFRLYQSLEVLQELREIYGSADAAVSFLASVTRKASIAVPTDVASPVADILQTSSASFSRRSNSHKNSIGRSPTAASLRRPTRLARKFSSSAADWPLRNATGAFESTSGNILQRITDDGTASSTVALTPTAASEREGMFLDGMQQYVQNPEGNLTNSVVDGAYFDWSSSLMGNLDLGPLSFNYDFYSDAFGIYDGQLQGI